MNVGSGMEHARCLLSRSVTQPLTVVRDCVRGMAAGNRRALKEREQRRQLRRNAPNPAGIFVWIPKTAGSSLCLALESQGAQKLLAPQDVQRWFRQRGIVTFGHIFVPALVDAGLVSVDYFRRARKFAVVRDPFDRAISLFEYFKRLRRLPATTTFDIFCEFIEKRAWEKVGMKNHDGLSQLNPQVTWVTYSDGKVFVRDIFRYEEIECQWPKIWALLGLHSPVPPLRRLNSSARGAPREYLTSRAVEIIREAYAADFEAFGYPTHPRGIH